MMASGIIQYHQIIPRETVMCSIGLRHGREIEQNLQHNQGQGRDHGREEGRGEAISKRNRRNMREHFFSFLHHCREKLNKMYLIKSSHNEEASHTMLQLDNSGCLTFSSHSAVRMSFPSREREN